MLVAWAAARVSAAGIGSARRVRLPVRRSACGRTTGPSSSWPRPSWARSAGRRSRTSSLRQRAVDDLIRPIQAALARVDGTLAQVEKERIASYAGLAEQVKGMAPEPTGAPGGDRKPGEGASRSPRARPLGRDPAPAGGRDGRHARLLRLRGAGHGRERGRPVPARSHRSAAGREDGGGGRQGAARRLPRCGGRRARRRARASCGCGSMPARSGTT